ncbi:MAG: OmpA family protein [Cyclobacteriaceae bacterium]|nr:OmpA family protein [Cyclobacteriaceae bacterium]
MSSKKIKLLFLVFLFSGVVFSQDKIISGVISKYDESNVVMAPDGKTLYFTFSNHILNRGGKRDKGDIWYSIHQGDSGWSVPMRIAGPINNHLNNRVLGFSPDGRIMYLHGQYGGPNKGATTSGISLSRWNGRMWTDPVNMYIPSFKNGSSEQGGFISSDGQVLLLSIDSYGSIGNEDIYVCFKNGEGWTEPLNLGGSINTTFQEFTPYLSINKRALFFSSNGRGGLGSSDIFVSYRLDDTWTNWSEPENLGSAYNSAGRDNNFLMVDQMRKVLWVSLNNSDEYGEIRIAEPLPSLDSLFSEKPEIPVLAEEISEEVEKSVFGRVTDQAGQPLTGVNVDITVEGKTTIVKTDLSGIYLFEEQVNGPAVIHVSVPTYIPQSENVNLQIGSQRELNFSLLPVEVGVTVNLKNVLFKRGTADFLPGTTSALNSVVELMKDNPNLKIELSGHTDNTGIAKKNVKLSQARVKVVKKYLVQQGVSKNRITGIGYGGDKPIASNRTEATRKLNRRVEFTITEN